MDIDRRSLLAGIGSLGLTRFWGHPSLPSWTTDPPATRRWHPLTRSLLDQVIGRALAVGVPHRHADRRVGGRTCPDHVETGAASLVGESRGRRRDRAYRATGHASRPKSTGTSRSGFEAARSGSSFPRMATRCVTRNKSPRVNHGESRHFWLTLRVNVPFAC